MYMLHMGDNPDAEGEPWPSIKWEDRTLFKQIVEEPQVLQLTAGREQSRYKMFSQRLLEHGTLQTNLYQLKRQGMQLETTYELTVAKSKAIPAKLAKEAEGLTPIVDLFTGTLNNAPRPDAIDTGTDGEDKDTASPFPDLETDGGASGSDNDAGEVETAEPQELMP